MPQPSDPATNERVVEKALVSYSDKDEPKTFSSSYGLLILTDRRLVYIKAKGLMSYKSADHVTDIDESLRTMRGSFEVPLNQVEQAYVGKKRIAAQKLTYLGIKFRNGAMNSFFVGSQDQEAVTISLCNSINSMLTRPQTPMFQPVYQPQPPAPSQTPMPQPAAVAPAGKDFRYCPSCGKQLPLKTKFCPFCGFSLSTQT